MYIIESDNLNIIKIFADENFNAEYYYKAITKNGKEEFEKTFSIAPFDINGAYLLKVLSLIKKQVSGKSEDSYELNIKFNILGYALYVISYIKRKAVKLPDDVAKFVNEFVKLASFNDLQAWLANFIHTYHEKIENSILDTLLKERISPIGTGDNYKIYEITDYKQAKLIAHPPDTIWCIVSSDGEYHLNDYLLKRKLRLFVLIFDDGQKFLLGVPNEEYIERLKDPNKFLEYVIDDGIDKYAPIIINKIEETIKSIDLIKNNYNDVINNIVKDLVKYFLTNTGEFVRKTFRGFVSNQLYDVMTRATYLYIDIISKITKKYINQLPNSQQLSEASSYYSLSKKTSFVDYIINKLVDSYLDRVMFEFKDKEDKAVNFENYVDYYSRHIPYIKRNIDIMRKYFDFKQTYSDTNQEIYIIKRLLENTNYTLSEFISEKSDKASKLINLTAIMNDKVEKLKSALNINDTNDFIDRNTYFTIYMANMFAAGKYDINFCSDVATRFLDMFYEEHFFELEPLIVKELKSFIDTSEDIEPFLNKIYDDDYIFKQIKENLCLKFVKRFFMIFFQLVLEKFPNKTFIKNLL